MAESGYDPIWIEVLPSLKGFGPALGKGIGDTPEKEGDKVGKRFGGALVAGVAVVGAGAALATKALVEVGRTFSGMSSKIATETGASGKDLDKMVNAAKRVGTQVPMSFDEIGGAVSAVQASLGGFGNMTEEQLSQATVHATNFSRAFEIDITRATQVAGQMMKTGLAKDSTEAFDLLTAASQKVPPALREDILDAADEYAPFFQQIGISGADAMGMLVKASEKGMYGIDKTGDALKEFTIRATDMSKSSGEAYKALGLDQGKMSADLLAGGQKGSDAFQLIITKLREMKDPVAQSQAALALFGTPLEDLGTSEIPKFLGSLQGGQDALGDFGGAADRMGQNLNSGLSNELKVFGNQIQVAVAPAAEWLFRVLSDGMSWVNAVAVPAIKDFIQQWSDGTGKAGELRAAFEGVGDKIKAVTGFFQENSTAIGIVGGLISAVFIPHFIALGVQAGIAGLRVAGAWIASTAGAVAAAATHSLTILQMIGGWIALGAQAVAQGVRIAAVWTAQRLAMLGQVAAMALVRGATVAWTAVQWLLNVALNANPLALIVIGIMLLVGAIILAWKNSETFRNVVMAVWGAIKFAAAAVVDWFINTALPFLKGFLDSMVATFLWMKDAVVGHFVGMWNSALAVLTWLKDGAIAIGTAIWNGIVAIFNWLKDGVLGAIRFMVDTAIGMFNFYRDTLIAVGTFIWNTLVAIFNFLKDGVLFAIRFLVDTAIGMFRFYRDTLIFIGTAIWNGLVAIFNFLKDAVLTAVRVLVDGAVASWNWFRDTLAGITNTLRDWILGGFNRLKDGATDIFRRLVDGVVSIWEGLKDAAAKPVRFVVDTVINNGLLKGVRWVGEKLGIDSLKNIPNIDLPGFASGGVIPGKIDPRHRDNILGLTRSGYPIARVEAGEMVVNRVATRRHRGLLEAINSGRVMDTMVKPLPGHAGGGIVRPVPGGFGRFPSYPGHTGVDFPVGMGTPVHAVMAGVVKAVRHLTTSYGKHVILGHDGNWETLYAHLSQTMARVGQAVSPGQVIGLSGSTGNSSGPHLHFTQQHPGGRYVNPTALLNGAMPAPGGGGGGIFDMVGSWIADKISNPVRDLLGKIPGAGAFLEIAKSAGTRILDGVVEKVGSLIGSSGSGDPGGAGVERWRGLVMRALAMVNQPASLADTTLRRMNQESGGNPNAVNNWDINARNGDPSKGLMQVIGGTFRAYALPGFNTNIMDPLSNILASMRYALARYGSLASAYNRRGGYASGTSWATAGIHPTAERGMELVASPRLMAYRGGERVFNNADTMRILSGGGGNHYHFEPTVKAEDPFVRQFEDFKWKIETSRMGASA